MKFRSINSKDDPLKLEKHIRADLVSSGRDSEDAEGTQDAEIRACISMISEIAKALPTETKIRLATQLGYRRVKV